MIVDFKKNLIIKKLFINALSISVISLTSTYVWVYLDREMNKIKTETDTGRYTNEVVKYVVTFIATILKNVLLIIGLYMVFGQ